MSASFTIEEFADYVRDLEFTRIEDVVAFIRVYFDDLEKTNKDDEKFKDKLMRYSILMNEFGFMLFKFAESVIEKKEIMERLIERTVELENRSNELEKEVK